MNLFKNRSSTFFRTYPKNAYVFIIASLVNSTGSALLWPLTTLYVHNILHRSYGEAGLVLFFQSLAGVIGQIVGGSLYHKLGARNLIVGSLMLSGLTQFGLIFAKAWSPYVIVMTTNGLLNAITMPAISAFIGFQWRNQQFQLFNTVYVSNNIGVAIGTSLAGLLAAISFDLTFLLNGVTTICFSIFFYLYLKRQTIAPNNEECSAFLHHSVRPHPFTLLKNFRAYLFLALGLLLILFSTSSWNSGIAPYLNQRGMSLARYSFLWTINGLVILVGQPFTTWFGRTFAKSLDARLMASASFYAIAFLFMWIFHSQYPDLMIGMVIATIGEMLNSPTVPTWITQSTGTSAPFYLGVVGGFGSAGRLIGPLLFGNLFDWFGITPILAVTTFSTLTAIIFFAIQSKFTYHSQQEQKNMQNSVNLPN
ncbi:MFS transporter [Sulfoacidibacillus thermotolerans]|uniref:Major facilitator superfamily (MFS) profile domain-containing protein n=1 Tax=Sulfoacidibacillus thermotolerans TaxID=1765684 RepID=A0A2U3DAV0_SULT2|nr:MFS transporter [Sulfoacidibacillus thermotolerans]PWI58401.1 hypothetical protein BM613_04100 [Sulfoacidibacillus thermotolerans]